jgi:hypothetical protein
MFFDAARPVILNGIEEVITRPRKCRGTGSPEAPDRDETAPNVKLYAGKPERHVPIERTAFDYLVGPLTQSLTGRSDRGVALQAEPFVI